MQNSKWAGNVKQIPERSSAREKDSQSNRGTPTGHETKPSGISATAINY
jgi:hypothetical protein